MMNNKKEVIAERSSCTNNFLATFANEGKERNFQSFLLSLHSAVYERTAVVQSLLNKVY